MNQTRILLLCVILITSLVTSNLFSRQSQADDTSFIPSPAADQLFRQVRKTLRELNTFSYQSEYRFGTLGKEPVTASYTMRMKKPKYFRMDTFRPDGAPTGILLHDGTCAWEYWPAKRPMLRFDDSVSYARTNVHSYMQFVVPAKDFAIKKEPAHLNDQMIWTVLDMAVFFEDSSAAYAPAVLKYDGAMIRGDEVVNGEPCTVLERSFNDRHYRQTLWISRQDFIPRKLRDAISGSILETWSDIRVNQPIADSIFVWEPPIGWTLLIPPSFDRSLPKPGTPFPDFDLPLIDGTRIRLSTLSKSVVLLTIWNLNCPPCREEIPYLQKLHSAFREKGLVVIGVTEGNKEHVTKFLAAANVTYPNVLVTSDDDSKLLHGTLNPVGAVPVTFIIDKEGKIADSWVGFDKDDKRLQRSLARLGIR